jgi:predicted NAD/FAD-binding protein
MASSIWSTPPSKAFSDFPARTLLQFMHNHHLLQILDRPQWLTLHGGSKSYVDRVVSQLKTEQIHQGPEKGKVVDAIRNDAEKWLLRTEDGEVHEFDRVIFATHADTTVKILKDEWDDEQSNKVKACLESFKFSQNTATLHSDISVSKFISLKSEKTDLTRPFAVDAGTTVSVVCLELSHRVT